MYWYNVKTKCGVAPLLADIKDKITLKYNDKEKEEILRTDGATLELPSRTGSIITNMHQMNSKKSSHERKR